MVISPQFSFDLNPRGAFTQCTNTRIFVPVPESVQGYVSCLFILLGNSQLTFPTRNPVYHGVIPGGNAFEIPQGPITDVPQFGRGFDWKCNLRTGTQILFVAGDDRGITTGGSLDTVVANPSNGDSSCLDETSPSSTPGTPAGGVYPTGTGNNPGNRYASLVLV
jgi:hypothetical protein